MKKSISNSLLLGFSGVLFLIANTSIHAASTTQMKACKMAVAGNHKFIDVPMAGISVRPAKKDNVVRFTVAWEGLKAHGGCRVSKNGDIQDFKIKEFDDGRRKGNHGGGSHSGTPKDIDGFYYDRHMGKWRDPDGGVCHSCTPENGFPDAQHNW